MSESKLDRLMAERDELLRRLEELNTRIEAQAEEDGVPNPLEDE